MRFEREYGSSEEQLHAELKAEPILAAAASAAAAAANEQAAAAAKVPINPREQLQQTMQI